MTIKSIKKIGLFCLCLTSLCLVGCFHVPDEDRLPSRNKVKTGDIKESAEIEQAVNSLLEGFDMVSSQLYDINKNESGELYEEGNENAVEVDDETSDNEELIENNDIVIEENEKDENENVEIQEDTISEEQN